VAVVRTDVAEKYRLIFRITKLLRPRDRGDIFLRNVGSYYSHTV
jgi:hypothetical protein